MDDSIPMLLTELRLLLILGLLLLLPALDSAMSQSFVMVTSGAAEMGKPKLSDDFAVGLLIILDFPLRSEVCLTPPVAPSFRWLPKALLRSFKGESWAIVEARVRCLL